MSSENDPSNIVDGSDPRRLRAMAHPVRLDLLELLHLRGPMTASQAAERLGITPKVCSYHLGLLGRYGVVEETGEGKGRARPWRVATTEVRYVHHPEESEEKAHAQDAFARTMLGRDAQIIDTFIDRRHALPETWRNVAAMSSNALALTPDQLRELRTELTRLLDRYRAQSRPSAAEAHPVHTAFYAVPTELDELTGSEE